MISLQRITTEFIEVEDRIRIIGEIQAAETVVLWLTRRLLDRLISHLTHWLEKQQGNLPRVDLMLSFAQQAAQNAILPQAPVSTWQTSMHWLVHSVDLQLGAEQLQVAFKGSEGQVASIGFAPTLLRQWLGILNNAYTLAEWPLDSWPAWMRKSDDPNSTQSVMLH